jgi:hypothetical protein
VTCAGLSRADLEIVSGETDVNDLDARASRRVQQRGTATHARYGYLWAGIHIRTSLHRLTAIRVVPIVCIQMASLDTVHSTCRSGRPEAVFNGLRRASGRDSQMNREVTSPQVEGKIA